MSKLDFSNTINDLAQKGEGKKPPNYIFPIRLTLRGQQGVGNKPANYILPILLTLFAHKGRVTSLQIRFFQ